ncbi:hypothetical protein PINS_up018606 [Pythium insidiosum]|nr:hypothetical protein PINS_up018606 [Pythium insidiosum]
MSRKKAEIQRVRQEAARLEKRYGYLRTFEDLNALKKENEELKRRCAVLPVQELSFETVNRILQAESETVKRCFELFTSEEVEFIMEETHACVESNLSNASFIGEPVSKFQGLGWSGQRVLHTKRDSDATLSVEVSKTFLRDSVTMLQRVSEDCVVVHRVLFNEKSGDIARSVDLLCRVQRAHDTIIISRALPVQKLRGVVNDPAGWCSSINVLSFAPIVHERSNIAKALEAPAKRAGCDFTYRGFVRRQVEMPLKVWALEIILMMMRLETMIVAPPVVMKMSK